MCDRKVYQQYFLQINPLLGKVTRAIRAIAMWHSMCNGPKKVAKLLTILDEALGVMTNEEIAMQKTPEPVVNLIFEDVGSYLQDMAEEFEFKSVHEWHSAIEARVSDIRFLHEQGLHEMLSEFDVEPILDLLAEMETALSIATSGLKEAITTGEYVSLDIDSDESDE